MRRGERASHVLFAKTVKKRHDGSEGGPADENDPEVLHVRRSYAVFNVDQIGMTATRTPWRPRTLPSPRAAPAAPTSHDCWHPPAKRSTVEP